MVSISSSLNAYRGQRTISTCIQSVVDSGRPPEAKAINYGFEWLEVAHAGSSFKNVEIVIRVDAA